MKQGSALQWVRSRRLWLGEIRPARSLKALLGLIGHCPSAEAISSFRNAGLTYEGSFPDIVMLHERSDHSEEVILIAIDCDEEGIHGIS